MLRFATTTAVICFLVCLLGSYPHQALGTTYLAYQDFGGTWHDADKTWVDDGAMCWAASVSNVLAWTGWGYPSSGSFQGADDIFQYYADHFRNRAGDANKAMKWWFDGVDPRMFASLEAPGGGYWAPDYNFDNYSRSWDVSDEHLGMQVLSDWLQSGYGIALTLHNDDYGTGHAITLWGYEYHTGTDGSAIYDGIFITDSNDNQDALLYLPLELRSGRPGWMEYEHYYLTWSYYGSDSWYLSGACGLSEAPFTHSQSVPEPRASFLLLLGVTGIFLINFLNRKMTLMHGGEAYEGTAAI